MGCHTVWDLPIEVKSVSNTMAFLALENDLIRLTKIQYCLKSYILKDFLNIDLWYD